MGSGRTMGVLMGVLSLTLACFSTRLGRARGMLDATFCSVLGRDGTTTPPRAARHTHTCMQQ